MMVDRLAHHSGSGEDVGETAVGGPVDGQPAERPPPPLHTQGDQVALVQLLDLHVQRLLHRDTNTA